MASVEDASNEDLRTSQSEYITNSKRQIEQAFIQPEPHLSRYLAEKFAKLADPNGNKIFTWCFLHTLLVRFSAAKQAAIKQAAEKIDVFIQACIQAGAVEPLVALAKEKSDTPEIWEMGSFYVLTIPFQAMDLIEALVPSLRHADEREAVAGDLLKHGIVDAFLQNVNEKLLLRRMTAARMMSSVAELPSIPLKLPPPTTARLLCALCSTALRDPATDSEQLIDPSTAWQNWIEPDLKDAKDPTTLGPWNNDKTSARWMATRLCGRVRTYAVRAVHCLIAVPPPTLPKLWVDVLECRPEIPCLLLDCAMLERPEYYPETSLGLEAVEALSMLFRWPSYWVPGVPIPTDLAYLAQDLKYTLRLFHIFLSQSGWAEKIIDIWDIRDADDETAIRQKFGRLDALYPDRRHWDKELDICDMMKDRFKSRVTILRLIASATHVADQYGIKNVEIESFLRISYEAMQDHQARDRQPDKQADDEYKHAMLTENAMSSISLMSLLAVLARRKTLPGIRRLNKPPTGLSATTSLQQIQHITHPDIIQRAVKISFKKAQTIFDEGNNKYKEGSTINMHTLSLMYGIGSELAAALAALTSNIDGPHTKEALNARVFLVSALGNAANVWLPLKSWKEAYFLALGAVTAAEEALVFKAIDEATVSELKGVLDEAKAGLDGDV